MQTWSVAVALGLTNLGFLLGAFAQGRSGEAQVVPAVLRAQKIELVDASGQVRASLEVAGNSEAVLRLRVANGAIRVKIGGAADGSGLLLYDPSTEPGRAHAGQAGRRFPVRHREERTKTGNRTVIRVYDGVAQSPN